MKTLILYSTEACHLCEHAKELIWQHLDSKNYQLKEVDITDDQTLFDRYSVTIPVLKNETTGQEINWPFDGGDIEALLQ